MKTRHFCEEMMRSHLVVAIDENDAVGKVQRWHAQFFEQNHPVPFVLNVAGPRESKEPGIQKSIRRLLIESLREIIEDSVTVEVCDKE